MAFLVLSGKVVERVGEKSREWEIKTVLEKPGPQCDRSYSEDAK